MNRGYKVKLYPTDAQKELLDKHFGCARWVYNEMIVINEKKYHRTGKGLTGYDMQSYLPKLKKQYPWLKDVNACALQIVCHQVYSAYINFFKKRAAYPKFKKKGAGNYSCINNTYIKGNKIRISKIGEVAFRGGEMPQGKVKLFTISEQAGNYYCSLRIKTDEAPKVNEPNKILGIDLGLKDLIVTSAGEAVITSKHLRSANIRTKAKALSRRVRGSNNYYKAKRALARLHMKVGNKRKDFNHKITSILVADGENQAFAIENLNVKGMMQNHKLARSIADAGWNQFRTFLTYKALSVGKPVLEVDRFYPSSKTCSECGLVNQSLTLSMREWTCGDCGTTHQRDYNAARNIALEAARNVARGRNVNPETLLRKVNAVEARSLIIPAINERETPASN